MGSFGAMFYYPVVNGRSDKRSELGVPIFPEKKKKKTIGEPVGATNRVSQPSSSSADDWFLDQIFWGFDPEP